MTKQLLPILYLLLVSSQLSAQNFEQLATVIDLPKLEAIESLISFDFALEEDFEEDGCHVFVFAKDSSELIYNHCIESDTTWINFAYMTSDLKSMVDWKKEADDLNYGKDVDEIRYNSTFIFFDDDNEYYFLFNHALNRHILSGSNHERFEFTKEMSYESYPFDHEKDGIALMKDLFYVRNSKDKTISEIIKDAMIIPEFSVLETHAAMDYLEAFRTSDQFEKAKKIIDQEVLADSIYMSNIFETMLHLQLAEPSYFLPHEQDEIILKLALENEMFEGMLMLQYVCEEVLER